MDSEAGQAKFEGWAIVEMMGHRREIGFVTTESYGAAALFRVDTPGLDERDHILDRPEWMTINDEYRMWPAGTKVRRAGIPARSVLIGPGSVYALNPCTEDAARKAIEKMQPRALILLSLPEHAQLGPVVDPHADIEDLENE